MSGECLLCGKHRVFGNKSKRYCIQCNKNLLREKKAHKKKKLKLAKEAVKTQAELDRVTSWLVRELYPSSCPHCGVDLDASNSNCGHFVSRTKISTRFSLKNMVAVDRTCNFYRPEHAYSIGKYLDKFWGEGTAEEQILLGNKKLKLSGHDRKFIFDLYKTYLDLAQGKEHTQEEKFQILKKAQSEYEAFVKNLLM